VCSLQEYYCEKRCEIQSGGQEMAVMAGYKGKIFNNDTSGEFVLPSSHFNMIQHTNSSELSLLKFLPLAYHHSHFLATTLDFTSFFTILFLGAAPFFTAGLFLD